MHDRRRRSPRFDALETRRLLSSAGLALGGQPASKPTPSAYLASVSQNVTHGAGGRATLKTTFTGSSTSEGPAKATSTELAKGNLLVSVQVLLQTSKGAVHLAFGPKDVTQNINSSLGTELTATYHITSGTGVFAREKGTGTISFWSIPGEGQSELTITPSGS